MGSDRLVKIRIKSISTRVSAFITLIVLFNFVTPSDDLDNPSVLKALEENLKNKLQEKKQTSPLLATDIDHLVPGERLKIKDVSYAIHYDIRKPIHSEKLQNYNYFAFEGRPGLLFKSGGVIQKFKLKSSHEKRVAVFLDETPRSLRYFHFANGELVDSSDYVSDMKKQLDNGDVPMSQSFLYLDLPTGESTIYVYRDCVLKYFKDLSVIDMDAVQRNHTHNAIIFFSVIFFHLAIVLYNLFMYIRIKERTLLILSIAIAFQLLSVSTLTGWTTWVPFYYLSSLFSKFTLEALNIILTFSAIMGLAFQVKLGRYYLDITGYSFYFFRFFEFFCFFIVAMVIGIYGFNEVGMIEIKDLFFVLPIYLGRIGIAVISIFIIGYSLYLSIKNNSRFGLWSAISMGSNLAFSIYYLTVISDAAYNGWIKHVGSYGTAIQSLVMSFALGDKIKFLEKKRKNKIMTLNHQLTAVKNSLEEKVEEKTRNTMAILANLSQGIFSVGIKNGLVILPDHSKALEDIVGDSNLIGTSPIQSIFAKSDLSHEKIELIKNILLVSINADSLQWELIKDNLPNKFKLGDKIIESDFNVILKGDIIEKIIISLKDATSTYLSEYEKEKLDHENSVILDIVSIGERNFINFIKQSDFYLNDSIESMAKMKIFDKSVMQQVFRNLHTLKGLSKTYSLNEISQKIHETETIVSKVISLNGISTKIRREVMSGIESIIKLRTDYIDVANDKLLMSINHFRVSLSINDLRFWGKSLIDNGYDGFVLEEMKRTYSTTLDKLIMAVIPSLKSLAKILDKPEPKVTILCDDDYFIKREKEVILQGIFIHLFKNSFDHGIEDVNERDFKGKSRCGNIHIDIRKHQHGMIVDFYDDGRGLNIQSIKSRGLEEGLLEPEHSDFETVSALIFTSGISSRNISSEISGRGVGLDAVKTDLNEYNSTIKIKKMGEEKNGFITFSFEIILDSIFLENYETFNITEQDMKTG